MSRRGENIRKRNDGRWEGRYKSGKKADGKTMYKSVYGKTYADVKSKLRNLYADAEQVPQNPKIHFDKILDLWVNANKIRLKPTTENKYRFMIERHIKPSLGSASVCELNSTVINAFLNKKLLCGGLKTDKRLAPSYVKTIAIIINAALSFAVAEGYCNPLKTPIIKPSVEKKNPVVLSIYDQNRLNNVIKENINATTTGIMLALYAGLRIGEICALSWSDVDFDNKVIHINHTLARVKNTSGISAVSANVITAPKTKTSIREIPISAGLLSILETMHTCATGKYIVSQSDSPISSGTFDYRYRAFLKANNFEIRNFHSLRHTFATRCIEEGVDFKSLSEMLGHRSVATTMDIYVHSSLEQKKKQIEKLNALY